MRKVKVTPYNEREILRYAGVRGEADLQTQRLLSECMQECVPALSYRYADRRLPREAFLALVKGEHSQTLRLALGDCEEVYLFAATIGIGVDRLISRYATISPAKALLFQAIGAERIEALCDGLCALQNSLLEEEKRGLGRRVSPGYGDFSLLAQREIFRALDCPKRVGITLTEGLLMAPAKSVTAVAGICETPALGKDCATCAKRDCEYRK